MFDAHCSACGARVLIGPSAILAVHPVAGGTAVTFRCSCGETGVEVVPRRRRRSTRTTNVA